VFRTFDELIAAAKKIGPVTLSVAAAHDCEVLKTVKAACDMGLADAILVGDAGRIEALARKLDLPARMKMVHEPNEAEAALAAVSLVRSGEAQVLLKGLMNTGDYLRAVLNPDVGLRTGRVLSHFGAYQAPQGNKLIYFTDTGINVAPDLQQKKDILANAIDALRAIGIDRPKIAILTANELVNPKMPATVDAKALSDLYAADATFEGIVEGPISMDVALSREAALHKGIPSRIAGDVDLFVFPNIEAGNLMSKALIHFANFKFAGIVLGAAQPVTLVSRADDAECKLNSLALACLVAARTRETRLV
jgi:phosphate butyryltransferase